MLKSFKYKPLLLTCILFCTASSHQLFGQQKSNKEIDLEVSIWTSEDVQLPQLEKEITKEIQLNPKSSYIHYLLAHTYIRKLAVQPSETHLLKQASDLAQQAIDLDPKSEYGYIALAEILDIMGENAKAISLIEEALKTRKESWRLHFHRIRLSSFGSSDYVMLKELKKTLKMPNAKYDIITPYVAAILNQKGPLEAIGNLEIWQEEFPSSTFLHVLAHKNLELGRYNKANEIYSSIYKATEDNEAMINHAILLYKHLDKPKEAIKLLQGVNHKKISIETQAIVYAHSAVAHFQSGNFKQSKHSFLNSLKKSNSIASLTKFIDMNLRETNHTDRLVEILRALNEEHPGQALLHAYLGEILSEQMNKSLDSLEYFTNAITLDPTKSEFYNGIGLSYYRLNKLTEALNFFSAASKVNPSDATAKYNQACVLAKLSQTDRAIASLSEAVELDPRLQLTAQNDPDFISIKNHNAFKTIVYESAHSLAH